MSAVVSPCLLGAGGTWFRNLYFGSW